MKKTLKLKLGLGIILTAALIAGYYGCGGSSGGGSDSGSSAPLFSTGVLDASFGNAGVVTTTIETDCRAYAIARQSDGKIVLAGYAGGLYYNFALARYNTDGSLDTTFDTDGVVTATTATYGGIAKAVAIQTDGKIVVAGNSEEAPGTNFTLVRYNTNGSLDADFGTGGVITHTIGNGNEEIRAIAIQTDGKIVAVGWANNPIDCMAMARYNTNGTLDTGFDSDGIVTTTFGANDSFFGIAIQSDGKIVASGQSYGGGKFNFAAVRYNTDGSLDNTFDSDGVVTTTIGTNALGKAMALQPDGKIVVAGYSNNGVAFDFTAVRYNTDGSLDTAFDSDGVVTTTIISGTNGCYAPALQSDGKIILLGDIDMGSYYDFALIRYNANGSLDTGFGDNGLVITNAAVGSNNSAAYAALVQPDNRILVAGYAQKGTKYNFALARYWR
ncbi:MAG: delta-60 repeat domain-containing protein [Planctomycetota bacterium]